MEEKTKLCVARQFSVWTVSVIRRFQAVYFNFYCPLHHNCSVLLLEYSIHCVLLENVVPWGVIRGYTVLGMLTVQPTPSSVTNLQTHLTVKLYLLFEILEPCMAADYVDKEGLYALLCLGVEENFIA